MENFENWNKKVRNKNLNENSNQRDYDKEPIIIKNPYEFFLANLFLFCHLGTMLILATYANYTQTIDINNMILWVFFGLGIVHIVATFYYYIIKNKCETKFTNKTIEFIVNGETKRVKNLVDLNMPFERNFGLTTSVSMLSIIIIYFLRIFIVLVISTINPQIFIYFIAYCVFWNVLNILFKFVFYMILGGKLYDFSLYPAFKIDYYELSGSVFSQAGSIDWHSMLSKYHMIYILHKQDYLDLQKYFLMKKNINLNSVKKNFLA